MQSLRCPHCRCHPGGLAAHPFTGVNARLLVLGLFGVFPVQSAPIQACAPSSSNSSKLISLIALALAPAQMAVWPAFAADGAHPLASTFLADLWAHSTPSGARSAFSSETLPALFFRRLSRFRAALFCFRDVTTAPCAHAHELHIAKAMCMSARAVDTSRCATAMATRPCAQAHNNTLRRTAATATRPREQAHDNTPRCMAATATRPRAQAHDNTLRRTAVTATRPCVQAHDNTSRRTVVTATRPCVQAHDNTLRCRAAMATRPCAQAHDNTSRCTAATTTRTGATKTTKLLTKPRIHVASHGGDKDNNYGDDDDECGRQGLVRKRMAFSYCVAQMQ